MNKVHSSVLLNRLWSSFYYNKNFIIKAGYPVLQKQLDNEAFLTTIDVSRHYNNTVWTGANVKRYHKEQCKRVELLKRFMFGNYEKYKKNIDIPVYKNAIHSSVLLNRLRTDFEYNKNFIINAGVPVLDNVIDKYCIFTESYGTDVEVYYNQTEWTEEYKKQFYEDHCDRLKTLRRIRQQMYS